MHCTRFNDDVNGDHNVHCIHRAPATLLTATTNDDNDCYNMRIMHTESSVSSSVQIYIAHIHISILSIHSGLASVHTNFVCIKIVRSHAVTAKLSGRKYGCACVAKAGAIYLFFLHRF